MDTKKAKAKKPKSRAKPKMAPEAAAVPIAVDGLVGVINQLNATQRDLSTIAVAISNVARQFEAVLEAEQQKK